MSTAIEEFFSSTDYQHIVLNAGVDWLTVTGETMQSKERITAMAHAITDQAMEEGQKLFHSNRNGYHLTHVEGIQWGSGHQGWMVCLSGQTARRYWMSFYAYSKNCTRLDLQTTIAYRGYTGREIREIHQQANDNHGEAFDKHSTLILNGQKGDTLYYGARASAQMGRIYDKHRHTKGDARFDKCIRFEVELKKPLSGQWAAWLCENSPDDKGITDRVLGWFFDRGMEGPPVYTYSDNAIQMEKGGTSIERKLAWLRTTVRSTYSQLRLLGYQTEADDALGVTDQIETVSPIITQKEA